jgi:hypothetical protein
MPPRCYGHDCVEDMICARKEKDNRIKKIRYWKKTYGVDINDEQYDMFSLHSTKIKKILPILDFIKTLELLG